MVTFFLVSAIACSWMLSKTLNQYFAYEFTTKFEVKHEYEYTFPAITLCNYRSDQKKYPDEFLTYSAFNFIEVDITKISHRTNMSKFGNKGLYKCIKINSGKNFTGNLTKLLNTKTSGIYYGLALDFKVPEDITSSENTKIFQFSIHDNHVHPTSVDMNMFYLLNSTQTNIELQKTVSRKLGVPYNQCYDSDVYIESAVHEKIKQNGVTYRQEICLELIQEEFITKQCNCIFFGSLRSTDEYDFQVDCTVGLRKDCWERESMKFNYLNYTQECPLECETTLFSYSVVTFGNTVNKTSARIYYNSLKYTDVLEIPKTTGIEVFADLGGTLGLFLGFSLLSFVEILDLGAQIFYILWKFSSSSDLQ